jgi:hypothetical protein
MIRTTTLVGLSALLALAGCSKDSSGSKRSSTSASTTAATTSGSTAATTSGTTTSTGTTGTGTTPPPAAAPTPEADPPVIALTAPARGQFMTVQQVLVEGNISDASGLAYFLINGNPVTPDANGDFSEPVALTAGLNVIELQAADPWANQTKTSLPVVTGQFLPETSVVQDAVAARLNRPAFDAIEQIAAQQLGGTNLGNLIMSQNPLFQGGNSLADVEVNATNASFGTPSLDLDPQVGGLFVRAQVPNVDVTVRASGKVIGIPYSVTTQVTATNAIVEALAVVTVNAGQVTTQLQNVNVDLQGFNFDINNVPGFLEQLARNAVRGLLERQIVKQVEDTVADEVNKAIAGANGPITQTVLGRQVTVHLIPTAVAFDADGCSVLTDGDMVVAPPAGVTLPTSPGSFATPGAAPAHGLTKALYLSANDDLLNRISHAAWRGGMMHLKVDQTTAAQLNLPSWLQLDAFLLQIFFPSLSGLNPNDPLEIEVSSATPAIFQTAPAPGVLQAGIGDLTVAFYVAPAGQPRQLVLEVGVQVQAEVGVTVTSSNLNVDLIGRPQVTSDVFNTPLAPLPEPAVENLIDFVVPPVVQLFARSWSGFPLPTTPGINPTNVVVKQDGPALDFVTIEGDL